MFNVWKSLFEDKQDKEAQRKYAPFKKVEPLVSYDFVEKIVFKLITSIKQVSGPMGITILTPSSLMKSVLNRYAPVIILLHDYHKFRDGCENCTDLNKCTSLLLEQKNKTKIIPFLEVLQKIALKGTFVDFFFEGWKDTNTHPEFKSALVETRKHLSHCVNNRNECQYNPVRIHMSDTRPKDNDSELLLPMIKEYDYEEFVDVITKLFPDFDIRTILDLVIDRLRNGVKVFFMTTFRTHPFFFKYSATHKQLRQLPEALQEQIYNHYHDYIYSIPDIGVTNDDKIKSVLQDKSKILFNVDTAASIFDIYTVVKNIISNIKTPTWIGVTAALDVYFLSRSLKTPFKGAPSQLSVLYAGDAHCLNLLHFLNLSTGLYNYNYFGYKLKVYPYIKCFEIHAVDETIYKLCDQFEDTIRRKDESKDRLTQYNEQLIQIKKLHPIMQQFFYYWAQLNPYSHFTRLLESFVI
jgi:hypothetical protein